MKNYHTVFTVVFCILNLISVFHFLVPCLQIYSFFSWAKFNLPLIPFSVFFSLEHWEHFHLWSPSILSLITSTQSNRLYLFPSPWTAAWKLSHSSELGSSRAHLLCFLVLTVLCCLINNVLQTIVLYSFICLFVLCRSINLVPVTLSWT